MGAIRARRLGALLFAVAVAAAAASGAAVASDHGVAVGPENATVDANGTATVPVTLSRAPEGVSGFDLTLAVGNESVATVANASVAAPVDDVANVSLSDDGETVRVAGIDGTDAVADNATDVRLATVTVRGEAPGEVRLTVVAVHGLQSDGGDPLAVRTANGTVTVESSAAATDGSTPGFTAVVAVLAVVATALAAVRRTA
ncbi:PGF-CTERM sorting domain-containing protein [Halorubrum sodomense]|uniref:PGF-CTERM sorting domain-containing protein n=1 Tax=Halorubrum sodomense TaxID=35743 RepID=UPI000B8836B9|nr:PGF-CTERM sorting domain-containing protein [Halorubrum sodomense]